MTAMSKSWSRRAALLAAIGAATTLSAPPLHSVRAAQAQSTDPFSSGESSAPIEIEAEGGLEWRRNEKLYVARGGAKAKRGDLTVTASTLSARYRDKAGGGTEIWQIEADGNVRMAWPGRTVTGGHAVYNFDTRMLRVTGGNLGVDTGEEKLTATESLEYQDGPQIAIARGEATVVQENRTVRADAMTGHFKRQADGKTDLVRVEADGNVKVKTPDTFASSAKGDYDLTTEVMTLSGDVKVTNGGNQFNGEYAEVNVRTGVSRLLGSPSGTGKVKSLIMPTSEPTQ